MKAWRYSMAWALGASAVLAVAGGALAQTDVTAFVPLEVGHRWHYLHEVEKAAGQNVDSVEY